MENSRKKERVESQLRPTTVVMIQMCLSLHDASDNDIAIRRTGSQTLTHVEPGTGYSRFPALSESLGGYVDVHLTLSRPGRHRAAAYAERIETDLGTSPTEEYSSCPRNDTDRYQVGRYGTSACMRCGSKHVMKAPPGVAGRDRKCGREGTR
ncbi:hypothetical protein O1611_g5048 [Lasiodiplodia mahajangana]|uniref:Uncharacterized protein n=1 Tax=Lasiodiplodia mahajangana TaxID=1108764 RepID=A0ACC2JM44_9PEZI|nr:hypothetical protein O1611_g5048 [Lasiodiplodia mahajangana]